MLTINIDGIESNVKPAIRNSIIKLESAQVILSSLKIPDDFIYSSKIKTLSQDLLSIENRIIEIKKWVGEQIVLMNIIENRNKNLIEGIGDLYDPLDFNTVQEGKNANSLTSNNGLEGIITSLYAQYELAKYSVTNAKEVIVDNYKLLGEEIAEKDFVKYFLNPLYKSTVGWAYENVVAPTMDTMKKTGATVVVGGTSMATGIFNFLEGSITNKTGSNKISSSINNWLYEETKIGKKINENSYIKYDSDTALKIQNVTETGCAGVATVFVSVAEGILSFGENIVDTVIIGGTSVITPIIALEGMAFGLFDGGIKGGIKLANDSVTDLWDITRATVAKDYVAGWFEQEEGDYLYDTLGENAYNVTRSIGNGIGRTAAIVGIAIATKLGPYIPAAIAGFGEGTANAWADGASTLEGLGYGLDKAVWEGFQWYLGGKINGLNMFDSKFVNSAVRVILDGLDGGVEGFVQPGLSAIYKDSYYDDNGNEVKFSDNANYIDRYKELFDDNGGWQAVITNGALGVGMSAFSEIIGSVNIKKTNNQNKTSNGFVEKTIGDDVSFETRKGRFFNPELSEQEIKEEIKEQFDSFFKKSNIDAPETVIDRAVDNVRFLENIEEVQNLYGKPDEFVRGFNRGGISYVSKVDNTVSECVHEVCHSLGTVKRVYGTAYNEAFTEAMARKISGYYYDGCAYKDIATCINDLDVRLYQLGFDNVATNTYFCQEKTLFSDMLDGIIGDGYSESIAECMKNILECNSNKDIIGRRKWTEELNALVDYFYNQTESGVVR